MTYDHVAVTETYGSKTVELRAEVGLLTHNVKVQGSSDDQWADKIEACPDGFDTGIFNLLSANTSLCLYVFFSKFLPRLPLFANMVKLPILKFWNLFHL